MNSQLLSLAAALFCFGSLLTAASGAEQQVLISTDFPGGNVLVLKNDGTTIEIAPDLRGGEPWFYWHFEAVAAQPGRVKFVFPSAQKLGVRGPAVSLDKGQTWQWLGADHTEFAQPGAGAPKGQESFVYNFTAEHRTVRLAVAIPYLQSNLDAFLKLHVKNPHLQVLPFVKTRGGQAIELLQFGEPGSGRQAMIVTARHHACESMASYVLEGLLAEAMSDSPAGREFRAKYVLFSIPIVDKDGVQAGDQGKNRHPHDHNRDYGPMPIYPEVKAIQDLGEAQQVQFALDLHCPFIRGDIHEAFHFVGLGLPHVKENVGELIAWLKEERPQVAMAPLNLLADPEQPGKINPRINAHHFALRPGSRFAATLEIPYAQAKCPLDADMARSYGRGLLRAWTRTKFLPKGDADGRGAASAASLTLLRADFMKLYRSKPQEAVALVQPILEDRQAAGVVLCEAQSLLSVLKLHQKQYAAALELANKVTADPYATSQQQITAAIQRLRTVALDPAATRVQVETALREFQQLPYPANEQQAQALAIASAYFEMKQDQPEAIKLARQQLSVAAGYEQGRILNRIALLHDASKQTDRAIAARQEAVELLRRQLAPKPARSVFGAMMAVDLFDALCGIPSATLEEKQAAGQQALDHDVVAAGIKQQIRKRLADLEK